MNGKDKIYALLEPDTLEIKYIGATKLTLEERLQVHIKETNSKQKSHKCNWIRSLLKEDKIPIIKLIENCELSIWQEREKYWIKYYREQGCKLTNTTSGGEGVIDYEFTDEAKENISKAITGRKLSEEHKAKLSKAMREYQSTHPEHKENSRQGGLKGGKVKNKNMIKDVNRKCIYCGDITRQIRFGHVKNKQIYYCEFCNKTYRKLLP